MHVRRPGSPSNQSATGQSATGVASHNLLDLFRLFLRRYQFGLLVAVLLVILGVNRVWGGPSLPKGAAKKAPVAAERIPPVPLVLDELPKPFTPTKPQTEADRDRLHALTLFAAGRMLEHRGDLAGALRRYQRALRYDPEALTVARTIVPLVARLKRTDEAIRYVLKAVELEEGDPLLLEELADSLAREGNFGRAIELYERAFAARKDEKKSAVDILLRWKMAEIYFATGKHKRAAEAAAWLIDALEHPKRFGLGEAFNKRLLSDSRPPYDLFAEYFLLADRPDEAIAAFKKSHQAVPNRGLLGYHLARVHTRTDKPQQALAELQQYLDAHLSGEGLLPYELLAEVLKTLGKENELLVRLEKLHAEDADNIALGYFLAQTYRKTERPGKTGQLDKAEPLYKKMLKKKPVAIGYQGLVEIYRKTGRTEKLLRVLGEVAAKTLSLGPLGEQGQKIAGDAALLKKLATAARKLLKTDPDKSRYGPCLAVALLAQQGKQLDTAGEFFDEAVRAKPDSAGELLLIWGVGLLVEEKFAEAAKVFGKGTNAKLPGDEKPTFYYYLAGALEMDSRTDEALAAARKAAESQPDSARFESRVAWILYHAKRYDEALNAYTELVDRLDSDHGSGEVREVLREARLVLSNLNVQQGNIPQAEEWLEQVLDEFPDDVSAMNDLGYLWADANQHLQRACRMIEKAVAAEPDNAAYRDSLGWVLYRLGRFEEAAAELEKAVAIEPGEGEILDHLGDAYHALNQAKKAQDAWRRAADAYRKGGEAERAEKMETKIKVKSR